MAKQKKKESLDKRLKIYAAAAAGTLALAPPANAAIHATCPAEPIAVYKDHTPRSIFLEGGNVGSEFIFNYSHGKCQIPTCTYTYSSHGVGVRPGVGPNGVLVNVQGRNAKVPPGMIISSNAPYGFRNVYFGHGLNRSGTWYGSPNYGGEFFNSDGYLGVTFRLPDDKQVYGWIEYEGTAGTSGTIKCWAYEDSGGPIRAGQKQSAPVPTFTELGMYLFAAMLIAGGVLRMRKQKEAG